MKLLCLFFVIMVICSPSVVAEDVMAQEFLEWIMNVDAMGSPTDYEALYFKILDITAGPDHDEMFDALPKCAQYMYVAAIFDMEIQNGGLCQFFVNCGGTYAVRVSETMRAIGLEEIATAYETFIEENEIDIWDLSEFRIDSVESWNALYDLYPFNDFDEEYMKLWKQLDFNGMMLKYADIHPEAFE